MEFTNILEMNFEKKVIDISGKKMKTKKDFILSLAKQAIEILKKKLEYQNRHTTHEFRIIFSTIAHEKKELMQWWADCLDTL